MEIDRRQTKADYRFERFIDSATETNKEICNLGHEISILSNRLETAIGHIIKIEEKTDRDSVKFRESLLDHALAINTLQTKQDGIFSILMKFGPSILCGFLAWYAVHIKSL
jgi:hypothetical protein